MQYAFLIYEILQYVFPDILLFAERVQMFMHIFFRDVQVYIRHLFTARIERDIFQQFFKHGVQPASADVLTGLICRECSFGDCGECFVFKCDMYLIRREFNS